MLEFTGLADILRAVSALYWIAGISLLITAFYFGKRWWGKVISGALVLAAFSYLPIQGVTERKKQDDFRKAADAHFLKLCAEYPKETITRKVENVEGLLLLKPREIASDEERRNQYWMGDPYGYDRMDFSEKTKHWSTYLHPKAYAFIEEPVVSHDNAAARFVRYTRLDADKTDEVVAQNIATPKSQYGLEWEDVSSQEDRRYWIAGGKVRIIDLNSKEVVAEHVGYIRDPLFGVAGPRESWINPRRNGNGYCQNDDRWSGPNVAFAKRVLVPSNLQEKKNGK